MSRRKIVQNVSCWILFSGYFSPLHFWHHARIVYASFLIQFSSLLSSSDQILLEIRNIVHLITEELKLVGLLGSRPPLFEFFPHPCCTHQHLASEGYPSGFALPLLHSAFSLLHSLLHTVWRLLPLLQPTFDVSVPLFPIHVKYIHQWTVEWDNRV